MVFVGLAWEVVLAGFGDSGCSHGVLVDGLGHIGCRLDTSRHLHKHYIYTNTNTIYNLGMHKSYKE